MTPLSDSLREIANAAQALADSDAATAEKAARLALATRPRGPAAARATLALGLALRDQERFAEAAEILGRIEPGALEPALVATARFERAQAIFYSGNPAAAAPVFAQVAQSNIAGLSRRAAWRAADSLLESGDAAGAVRAYQDLIGGERGAPPPGARLALATALRAAGDAPRAQEMLRALWIDHPADPAGRAAARALRAWRAAGGPVPPPTPDQRLARAARFLELALPRRALRTLDRLDATHPPAEPATRSALLRAMALVQLGRLEAAGEAARRLQRSPEALGGTRAGAELILARVAARSGHTAEASRRYRALSQSRDAIPGLPPARARDLPEDARFLSAWLWFEAGDYARAVEQLRAFARAQPAAARAEDARWFEAWSLWRLGRRAEAIQSLERLAHGGLLAASLYWQARLHDDPAQQRALYQRVIRESAPGSWYALLAADRLARLGAAPALTLSATLPAPVSEAAPPRDGDPLRDAIALLAAGLRADAVAALRGIASAPRGSRGRSAQVAELAAAAGDAELPFRIARDQLPPGTQAARWLYPLAFEELLDRSAQVAGCDRDLYRAILRRESAFRPDARSGAGAVGLVQLIPPTAERLAATFGVPARDVRLLEEPTVSVPLGAAYLALLTERFQDPAVVLAAYNAGPRQAAAWARSRGGVPLDEWVEGIPYRETRRYVKNVLADAAVYRFLWRGGTLAIDGGRPVPRPAEGVAY